MLISGVWHLCDDGVLRPLIRAEILVSDGSWVNVPLLVDTGADRTIFSADILQALRLQPLVVEERLGGMGGVVNSIIIETRIRLTHENNAKIMLRGQFAAVPDTKALDMSVLGRDVTNPFAAIVDWPQCLVFPVGQRHQYSLIPGS